MPKRQRSEAPAAKSPASIGDALKTNLRNNQMKAAGKRQPAPSAAGGAAAGAQPAAAAAWQTDESAPFPRGGSVALTPLEYKAVATAAKEDALFEMAEGGGAVGGNAGKYDVDDDDAPALASGSGRGGGELLRAHALLRKQLTAGMRVLGAVSEIHSDRLLVQLPNRLMGRIGREEISDELHAAMVAESLSAPPDLRKLFTKGEVLCCVALPPASRGSTAVQRGKAAAPPVELSLRLSLVQRAPLEASAPRAAS